IVLNFESQNIEGIQSGHDTAAAGSTVHVIAWVGGNVDYKRSTNAGQSWGGTVKLATKTASITYVPVGIGASGNLVVAAFASKGPGNARGLSIRRSTDGGVHWNAPLKVASYTSASNEMGYGDVAVSGKDVYIVWTDRTNGAVLLRRSTDSGASLKAVQSIGTSTN